MSAHTIHRGPSESVLYDDCPRCEEIARTPTQDLDRDSLRRLVRRYLDSSLPASELSNTELRAHYRIGELGTALWRISGGARDGREILSDLVNTRRRTSTEIASTWEDGR